jgi:large subunit ribosomal protein L23
MKTIYEVIQKPLVTEKSTLLKEDSNSVVFEVAMKSTKTEIKTAIQKLFNVKVESVNTSIVRGKPKRMGTRSGYCQNWKKAIVKLEQGTDLDVFGVVGTPDLNENSEA